MYVYIYDIGRLRVNMVMELRWNGGSRGKPKYWLKNMPQCHLLKDEN
jgi:hypothetical protein